MIITEHFHVSFIIKLHTDVTWAAPADIISCYRIHNNFHSCVRSCVDQNVETYIGLRLLFLYFLLYLLIERDKLNRILYTASWCFIYKFNKLVVCSRSNGSCTICKVCIPIGSHGYIGIQSVLCIACEKRVTGCVYRSVKRKIGWLLRIHHQHVIDLDIELIFYVFEMFVMKISV